MIVKKSFPELIRFELSVLTACVVPLHPLQEQSLLFICEAPGILRRVRKMGVQESRPKNGNYAGN